MDSPPLLVSSNYLRPALSGAMERFERDFLTLVLRVNNSNEIGERIAEAESGEHGGRRIRAGSRDKHTVHLASIMRPTSLAFFSICAVVDFVFGFVKWQSAVAGIVAIVCGLPLTGLLFLGSVLDVRQQVLLNLCEFGQEISSLLL